MRKLLNESEESEEIVQAAILMLPTVLMAILFKKVPLTLSHHKKVEYFKQGFYRRWKHQENLKISRHV